jgi:hypothetical protein
LVQFVLQADDVRALIQDAMPPVSQPPTLQKSQLMTTVADNTSSSSGNRLVLVLSLYKSDSVSTLFGEDVHTAKSDFIISDLTLIKIKSLLLYQ